MRDVVVVEEALQVGAELIIVLQQELQAARAEVVASANKAANFFRERISRRRFGAKSCGITSRIRINHKG